MGAPSISDAMEVAVEASPLQFNGSSEVLSSSLSVDTSLPFSEMKPRIIVLCKDIFDKWSNLDDSCFSVEKVSGGITNLLLKVTVKEEDGNEVSITVRLYGPNTDIIVNRERELQAIGYLSAAGFGAKLLALFGNGMVQSFIKARTLTPPDMRDPKLAAMIAKEVRHFHEVEIPGCKESQLWVDLSKFFEKASKLKFDENEKQEKYQTISFKEVQNEINELKALTDCLDAPVVFSHNDLLSGNFMLNEEEGKLYIIDFEYGSYNYRGFDIGNHFNEYAGYDCDYSLYPTKDEQYHFFRHYLRPDAPQEGAHCLCGLHSYKRWELKPRRSVAPEMQSESVPDSDLEALYVETNAYMLASHLSWGLWALIQAKISPIDFDYLSYFFWRYNEYKKQKEDVFSLAKSHLNKSQA